MSRLTKPLVLVNSTKLSQEELDVIKNGNSIVFMAGDSGDSEPPAFRVERVVTGWVDASNDYVHSHNHILLSNAAGQYIAAGVSNKFPSGLEYVQQVFPVDTECTVLADTFEKYTELFQQRLRMFELFGEIMTEEELNELKALSNFTHLEIGAPTNIVDWKVFIHTLMGKTTYFESDKLNKRVSVTVNDATEVTVKQVWYAIKQSFETVICERDEFNEIGIHNKLSIDKLKSLESEKAILLSGTVD